MYDGVDYPSNREHSADDSADLHQEVEEAARVLGKLYRHWGQIIPYHKHREGVVT